jgi:hypothetical protein
VAHGFQYANAPLNLRELDRAVLNQVNRSDMTSSAPIASKFFFTQRRSSFPGFFRANEVIALLHQEFELRLRFSNASRRQFFVRRARICSGLLH